MAGKRRRGEQTGGQRLSTRKAPESREDREETYEHLRVDQSEGIDDDLALDRLDRVDDDGHCARVELLK